MPNQGTPSSQKNNKSGGLSVSFFQYVIEKVEEFVGSDLIREFEAVKQRRDRYLREEWAPRNQQSDQLYFREIDYEYLLTLLNNKYEEDSEQLYDLYIEIARVCVRFGELKKAKDLLKILGDRLTDDNPHYRITYLMIKGKWAIYTRELDQALACYTEALELYTELDDRVGMVKALNNLGIIAFEQWETKQGKQYFEQASQMISQSETNIPTESQTFVQMNLGILEGMQGDFDAAVQLFESLESDFPDLEGMPKIKIMLNKGVALKDAGQMEKARSVLGDALEAARQLPSYHAYGDAVLDLAEVNILAGNYEAGRQNLSEAFKVFSKMHDRPSLAEAYRIFGILYREQNEEELAESQFEISIKIGKEYGNLLYLTEAYYEYSHLAEQQGDPERQRDYLLKSLSYARAMHGDKRADRVEAALNNLSNSK